MNTLEDVFFSKLESTKQVHSEPLTTPLHLCFNWQQVLDNLIITTSTPAAHSLLSDDNGIDSHELHEKKKLHDKSPRQEDGSVIKIIKENCDSASSASGTIPLSENNIIVSDGVDEAINKMRFYVVVFRSVRREVADAQALYAADAAAHQEATSSGGLIRYWYGILNLRRECFATCIWHSREDAERASKLPKHRIAVSLASRMYESYHLERYWLNFDSTHGALSFEKINVAF